MSVTPNRGLPLMEPSQSEPEVVYNSAMEILDVAETLEVEQSGDSPGVIAVTKIKFIGATVSGSAGVAIVTVDPTSGGGGGGSLELTDGSTDLTGVTKITVSGLTVGGTSAAATLTASGGGGGGGSPTFSGCQVTQSADQNMGHAALVNMSWDTETYDTDGYHDGVHPTRLTAPITGYYLVIAGTRPNSSSPPSIYFNLSINGSPVLAPSIPASSIVDGGGLSVAWEGHLTAGDYVEIGWFNTSGSDVLSEHTSSVFSMSLRGFSGAKVSAASTVAALPGSPTQGDRAFVTDATATTFLSTVAGGGSNKVPVAYDGTNWVIG